MLAVVTKLQANRDAFMFQTRKRIFHLVFAPNLLSCMINYHSSLLYTVVPGQKHSGPKYSVEIVKARMKKTGKPSTFEKGEVTYVKIRESSANIDPI